LAEVKKGKRLHDAQSPPKLVEVARRWSEKKLLGIEKKKKSKGSHGYSLLPGRGLFLSLLCIFCIFRRAKKALCKLPGPFYYSREIFFGKQEGSVGVRALTASGREASRWKNPSSWGAGFSGVKGHLRVQRGKKRSRRET